MAEVKEIFPGVYEIDGELYTKSWTPGFRVYGEKIININGEEYRHWDAYRSKLAGAIKNGLRTFPFSPQSSVLYLGASSGTTVSHLSDILREGIIFAVEISSVMMSLLMKNVVKYRENVIPILADANKPEEYDEIGTVDVIYQDVAQRNQAEILLKNSRFLRERGIAMFCVKSQSIDVTADPAEIFEEVKNEVSKAFEVVEEIPLEPYDEEHLFLVLRKRD